MNSTILHFIVLLFVPCLMGGNGIITIIGLTSSRVGCFSKETVVVYLVPGLMALESPSRRSTQTALLQGD